MSSFERRTTLLDAALELVGTDAAWSHGDGPEARGSAGALLLLLFGRRPGPGELTGPGADTLAARLGAA